MQGVLPHGSNASSSEKGEEILHRVRTLVHNLDWDLINFSHRLSKPKSVSKKPLGPLVADTKRAPGTGNEVERATANEKSEQQHPVKVNESTATVSNTGGSCVLQVNGGQPRPDTGRLHRHHHHHHYHHRHHQNSFHNKAVRKSKLHLGRTRSSLYVARIGGGGGNSSTLVPQRKGSLSRRFSQLINEQRKGRAKNSVKQTTSALRKSLSAVKGVAYHLSQGPINRISPFNRLIGRFRSTQSVKSASYIFGPQAQKYISAGEYQKQLRVYNQNLHRTKSLPPQTSSNPTKRTTTTLNSQKGEGRVDSHKHRLKSGGLANKLTTSISNTNNNRKSNTQLRVQLVAVAPAGKLKHSSNNNNSNLNYNNQMSAAALTASPKTMLGRNQESVSLMQTKQLSKMYRAKVIDAYQNRRIFTVHGNYYPIRQALIRRGWLEKLTPTRYPKLQMLNEEVLLQHARHGNDYETVVISKIINHFPAFFIWQSRNDRDLYMDIRPYRNRIRRNNTMDFCTKVGLIGCAEQLQWFNQEDVADMQYPRFFRMNGSQEEQNAFIEEFRMTQCRNVLRYILKYVDQPEQLVHPEMGSISTTITNFAMARVKRQVDEYESVPSLDVDYSPTPDDEWKEFMMQSYKFIWHRERLRCSQRDLIDIAKEAKPLLAKLDDIRPDYKWDGYRNLWILKPGYQCRGLGIVVRNNLSDILSWSSNHPNRRYIVQKYIESPLLIYKTKFDVRQYMVVYIRESTIQIWLYRDCYLRFSSQEYSTEDLRESIHLTNNSVQKKYKNKLTRDPRLPRHNMWSLEQFKTYLNQLRPGENLWERKVYEGFKKNLIAVVLASLDETNLCENAFELYGCDFMLDEQFNPILIEINSTPDMSHSTEVTKRICPMVLQDVVKVIVDLPRNNRASTGLFELIYEVNYKFKQDRNQKDSLNINGKSINVSKRMMASANMAATTVKTVSKPIPKKPKKVSENVVSESQQPVTKSETKPAINSKSKNSSAKPVQRKQSSLPLKNVARKLKTVTREALALRYTIPK